MQVERASEKGRCGPRLLGYGIAPDAFPGGQPSPRARPITRTCCWALAAALAIGAIGLVGLLLLLDRATLDLRLGAAASGGDAAAVRELLRRGADPNCRDNGYPALEFAVQSRSAETVRALLDAGADVNARTPGGGSVLMGAADLGLDDIVRLLLARGADASLRDSQGWTAERWAKEGRYPAIVRLLHEAAGQPRPAVRTKPGAQGSGRGP